MRRTPTNPDRESRSSGPTTGREPSVWTYLLELIAEADRIELTETLALLEQDAMRFAKRSVWPVSTIRTAFVHLLRQGLIVIDSAENGGPIAYVAEHTLGEYLRRELDQEKSGDGSQRPRTALNYLRGRRQLMREGRLPQLIDRVERAGDFQSDQFHEEHI